MAHILSTWTDKDGHIWAHMESDHVCDECNGTGVDPVTGADCPICGGKGIEDWHEILDDEDGQ